MCLAKVRGVDGHEVMEVFCHDTKLNLSPYNLKTGFAYGGSCLPKKVRAVAHIGKAAGLSLPLVETFGTSNRELVAALREAGIAVCAHDPAVTRETNIEGQLGRVKHGAAGLVALAAELGCLIAEDAENAFVDSEALVIKQKNEIYTGLGAAALAAGTPVNAVVRAFSDLPASGACQGIGCGGDDQISGGAGAGRIIGDFDENLLQGTNDALIFADYPDTSLWQVSELAGGHSEMTQTVETIAGPCTRSPSRCFGTVRASDAMMPTAAYSRLSRWALPG